VVDLRNAVAHNRALLSHERDLLSGIAGHLGNLWVRHRNRDDGPRAHYPIIESLRDNFGRNHESWTALYGDEGVIRLEVGDVLRLQGRAVDPRGREISWWLRWQNYGDYRERAEEVASGGILDHAYKIETSHVGEGARLYVIIRSSSDFHRYSKNVDFGIPFDDAGLFGYSVNPPLDS
jgi:hypothetical protein